MVKGTRFPKNWHAVFRENERIKLSRYNPIWSNIELDVAILEIKSIALFTEGLELHNQDVNQKMFAFKNNKNTQMSFWEAIQLPKFPEEPSEDIRIEFSSTAANIGAPIVYVSAQNSISLIGMIIEPSYKKGIKETGKTIIRNIQSVYESIDPIIPGDIRRKIFKTSPYFKCHERLMERMEIIQLQSENW